VPHYDSTFTQVFTNLPTVTPYRGAGRQHGVFVMERLLDFAAHELNIDPAEIRRRNLIPPDAFPYNNEIIYQDFEVLEYDSGNYEPVLDMALEAIGYGAFKDEQKKLRAEGRHVGIGLACYVEGTGIGPYEGAKVQVQSNGKISSVSLSRMSTSSPAIPISSIGAPAPLPAAAPWSRAMPSTKLRRWCGRRR
jgi:CO/xanthine dehydrogenase Mo-binding subunit